MDTFVIRVYRSGHDAPSGGDRLRGVVEEVATGFQATFQDAGELLTILSRHERDDAADPQPTTGDIS